jgi:hypothetical protein
MIFPACEMQARNTYQATATRRKVQFIAIG